MKINKFRGELTDISAERKHCCYRYAMLTTFNEVDMTALMALRNDFKDVFLEKHGVKLGFMSAFLKAASSGLQAIPSINAVIDNNDIIYRDYTDISIAVATPKGLVVPVLRDVNRLGFADIEKVRIRCSDFVNKVKSNMSQRCRNLLDAQRAAESAICNS